MIFNIIFFLLFSLLTALLSWLPGYGDLPMLLPFGIDGVFVSAVSYFRGAIETLPYLEVVFNLFGIAILFEVALLILRLFLGSRSPSQIN